MRRKGKGKGKGKENGRKVKIRIRRVREEKKIERDKEICMGAGKGNERSKIWKVKKKIKEEGRG